MTIEAHVENGQIILPGPLQLPDGTKVRVQVAEPTADPGEKTPSLLERMGKSVGSADYLPADASQQAGKTLHDFLRGYLGVIDGPEDLSHDTGKQFGDLLEQDYARQQEEFRRRKEPS